MSDTQTIETTEVQGEQRISGSVEFFNNLKGWGVITAEGESFFVHHSHIVDKKFFPDGKPRRFRTLKAGSKVSFTPDDRRAADKYFYMRSATKVESSDEG